jgi:hypothetical protein
MNSIHECQFTECECEWEWAFSRYFRTECECECELKISKTTHSPHQFSQNFSKTTFIPSLFYIQDYNFYFNYYFPNKQYQF